MLSQSTESPLATIFRKVIAKRALVMTFYGLVLIPLIYFATRVQQDNSLDRLIVESDVDYRATQAFSKVFLTGEYVLVIVEADDPFKPDVLKRFIQLEHALGQIKGVQINSALGIYRRAQAGFVADKKHAQKLRRFLTGTDLFKKQGLLGDHFLSIPLIFKAKNTTERTRMLETISEVVHPFAQNPSPFKAVKKVGQPYLNHYLDTNTREIGLRLFPVFGLLVVILIVLLYRSFRTLLAFVISLLTAVAISVGLVGLAGVTFTIVSALMPMTILITCTATLVYLHSRFVEYSPERSVYEHQIFTLTNKFLACTASLFAAAVGFAALAVSPIRPIREMGLSVAAGMVVIWFVSFTLFPALQRTFKTPTRKVSPESSQFFLRFTRWLPQFTYRYRWVLVPAALLLSGGGLVALFGLPGLITKMQLQTNPLDYINKHSSVYQHTKRYEELTAGLAISEVWLSGKLGVMSEAEALRALDHFHTALEKHPQVGAVVGLPLMLRMLRYIGGRGDRLPEDLQELESISDQLETYLMREPMLQGFVDGNNLSQTRLMVISRTLDYQDFAKLSHIIKTEWQKIVHAEPIFKEVSLKIVGLAPLTAKISYYLVPTLVESFGLTVLIIFATFVIIFRNGAARLMAMIPSVFAILLMFVFMRFFNMSLNVATIIIASTVLGATENDQIHFFYHFLEKRKLGGTVEESLQHTLLIAGRAILFASLINAIGFLAFALADVPPIRQFGILACLAFLLSMLADFTALPAALWLIFREDPHNIASSKKSAQEMNSKKQSASRL